MVDPTQLVTYTIYHDPLDFPGKFVVRRFRVIASQVVPDDEPWHISDDLTAARESIPVGLYRMVRSNEDDPPIVETWL